MFFSKGLKIKNCGKDVDLSVKKISQPEEVWIPLIQHIGQPCVSLVEKGDKVCKGQKIGESENFISSYVHSSVSGIVKDIKKISHPVLNFKVNSVIIINDKKDVSSFESDASSDVKDITSKKIITSVRNAGVSGMGGAAFPTHVKLSVPGDKKVEYFILNAAECEPLLKADASLINLYPEFVLKGMKLAMKAAEIKKGYIGIEKKNSRLADRFKSCLNNLNKWLFESQIEIVMLPDRYPQGAEKQLVDTVLKRKIPPG